MLNFIACGDLHLRKTTPQMRKDDFSLIQQTKLDFINDAAKENRCAAVIFPGDVFDKATAPHGLVEWAIRQFKKHTHKFIFVFGQHDLRYHTSDKQNSPLGVLCAGLGEQAIILSPEQDTEFKDGGCSVSFRGCSWSEELPLFGKRPVKSHYNFLALHRPVTIEKLPWEHADLITADELMSTCNADVFICGDNHTYFIKSSEQGEQTVLNMGSVCRTSTAQIKHKPMISLIKVTKTGVIIEQIKIPIRNGVFNEIEAAAQALAESYRNEKLIRYTKRLEQEFDAKLSFTENLRLAVEKTDQGVKDIIAEVLTAE